MLIIENRMQNHSLQLSTGPASAMPTGSIHLSNPCITACHFKVGVSKQRAQGKLSPSIPKVVDCKGMAKTVRMNLVHPQRAHPMRKMQ